MAQRVQDISSEEVIDEKKILKEAKEKEKEIKKEIKEAKKAEIEEKKTLSKKAQIRKKPKHGKKYRNALKEIDKSKEYLLSDAIALIKEISSVNFNSTIEIHIKIDRGLQNLRGTMNLPGGTVKTKNVLVVDEKNIDKVSDNVKSNKIDFDILIADSAVMKKLAPLAKILGPKGLMPNPKSGTVSDKPREAEKAFKSGKIEYKTDKGNVIHLAVGKKSFEDEKISQNIQELISHLPKDKINSAFLTSTMSPSIRLDLE